MDIVEAVKASDSIATLVALRDKLAETLDKTGSARDVAALSKQLLEVEAKIERMAVSKKNAERVRELGLLD